MWKQQEIRMRKLLVLLDKGLSNFEKIFLGIILILLTVIVNLQVLARYVLKVSLGGVEELPIYLMMIGVWVGSAFVAKKDHHVKIELLDGIITNKRALAAIKILIKALTAFFLAVFTVVSFKYIIGTFEMGDTSPGLGIPLFILQGFIPFSTGAMTVFYVIQVVKETGRVIKWS
jgi:TRAP-type C4-dicarboxylate transport system permease small subunit